MDFSHAGLRLMMLRFPPCPLVLAHCLLSCLFSQAEFQSFCSQYDMNRGAEGRQMLCHRRLYPPLPPPPPPPPPPPALLSMAPEAPAPLLSSWWTEIIVIGSTGSALTVFLFLTVFIFYKAIKRKPLKKRRAGPVLQKTSSIIKTSDADPVRINP